MADDVTFQPTPATPASGTIISADELAGAVKVQNVKLMDGTSASSQVIASGNGVHGAALRVTLASDSTGVIAVTDNGGSLTVDGTVAVTSATFATAAKQDTGNTSLGTIDTSTAAAAVSLAIIDDWDETDRAKVNPIVGQAGVASGAGAVGATVQRTTLASDDPAVASLSVIDDWDESDRAKVNVIAGQAGVTGGLGVTGAAVLRVTQATDVNVNTVEVVGASIFHGQTNVTTAGTEVAIASSQAVKSVTIKAKVTNSDNIFVGGNPVTSSTGFILQPGEAVSLDIANLATVFIDSAVNGEGVSYVAVGV